MTTDQKTKKRGRGFAVMDPAKVREIASLGGKASHGGGRPKGSKTGVHTSARPR